MQPPKISDELPRLTGELFKASDEVPIDSEVPEYLLNLPEL